MFAPKIAKLQRKTATNQKNGLAARGSTLAAGTNATCIYRAPDIVHQVLRSRGQALEPSTRAFMEPRLGYDFGQVRVHADSLAADSARAVNAQAYTVGREMVFGTGRYAPNTSEGLRLIAHELMHVVQQRGEVAKPETLSILSAEAAERARMPLDS